MFYVSLDVSQILRRNNDKNIGNDNELLFELVFCFSRHITNDKILFYGRPTYTGMCFNVDRRDGEMCSIVSRYDLATSVTFET